MHGEPAGIVAHLAPESYFLDYALLSRPGNHAIQLTLLSDFKNNLPLYRSYAWWIQEHAIPVLVLWGQRDQVVAPAGVEAFRKAAGKKATRVFLIDGGHMLFETHKDEVVGHIRQFLTAYKTAMHSDV
jgi:pimeloyl-ACP methyl ester carboxylesterase